MIGKCCTFYINKYIHSPRDHKDVNMQKTLSKLNTQPMEFYCCLGSQEEYNMELNSLLLRLYISLLGAKDNHLSCFGEREKLGMLIKVSLNIFPVFQTLFPFFLFSSTIILVLFLTKPQQWGQPYKCGCL